MNFQKFLIRITSYLMGVKVAEFDSPLNGRMYLHMINGRLTLNTDNANQSFATLHQLWQKVFRKIKLRESRPADVLLLGLGGGSVPTILEEEMRLDCRIDAVEYDPVMIDIARKYFHAGRFTKLNIIQGDAMRYVRDCTRTYDVIIIDLFNDNRVPDVFYSGDFNRALVRLCPAGTILFNHIAPDTASRRRVDILSDFFVTAGKRKVSVLEIFEDNMVQVVRA